MESICKNCDYWNCDICDCEIALTYGEETLATESCNNFKPVEEEPF